MSGSGEPSDMQASGGLPPELVDTLRSLNPWWVGQRGPALPSFRRWPFERLLASIKGGISPATVLRGPRRVGKTVLLRQIIEFLLDHEVAPERILYLSFDELPAMKAVPEPVLTLCRWFERRILRDSFNECGRAGRPAMLFLDEVQNLDAWAPQVKNLVDNHMVRVLVTGSSSLRIEAGRDSLAGRITTTELGPLLIREIAGLRFGHVGQPLWPDNGLEPVLNPAFWHEAVARANRDAAVRREAFGAFSDRGGYPIAQQRPEVPWHELADYLNETVVGRAIQHDLRTGPRGRRRNPELLEEVFRLCCRYAGQAAGPGIFVPELAQALRGPVGWDRIRTYLGLLEGALLVRLVPPLELRLKRSRGAAKICLCDHALRASWLQELIPLDPDELAAQPHLSDLAGHLAESVLGYHLASIPTLDVAHFPARGIEPEVDFVLVVGTRRIPIEVKYRRRIDPHRDTLGLRAFLEKSAYNAPYALLVTSDDNVTVPDPRIIPISLSALLWIR